MKTPVGGPAQSDARVGVYVCHCGTNIAGMVDVEAVSNYAATLNNVIVARHYAYMCSDPGQSLIKEDIKNERLDRVVVASCSPLMHEPTFRKACADGGLNPFLFQMTNIREHCSWVTEDRCAATKKPRRWWRLPSGASPGRVRWRCARWRSSNRRWWLAGALPASRRLSAWRTRASMSPWSSANPPSAGTCPACTKRFQRATVRPEFLHRKWCPLDATQTSR